MKTTPLITAFFWAIGNYLLPLFSYAQTIDGGGFHSIFICSDSTVRCWGLNFYGQFGNGTYAPSNAPVPTSSLTSIKAIAGGESHSLFLKNNGTLWACGYNLFGQLGNGNNNDSNLPVQVSLQV